MSMSALLTNTIDRVSVIMLSRLMINLQPPRSVVTSGNASIRTISTGDGTTMVPANPQMELSTFIASPTV